MSLFFDNNVERLQTPDQGTWESDAWTPTVEGLNQRTQELRSTGQRTTFATENGGYRIYKQVSKW
jgi:hypothetical protein